MHVKLPAWLRPATTSRVAARLAQAQSPWMDSVHLLWSAWVFVVPVFSPRGYDTTWLLCTLLSYPLFLLLYARMLLAPRDTLNRYAWAMGLLSAALLPVYTAGISYFVFACLSLRPSTRQALWRHFALLLVLNAGYLAWAHWLGMAWPSLVWLPVSVLGMAAVGAVYSVNERKDTLLRLSQDEVRRLAATAERERIGRDLHDLLGHTLSLVALKSDLAVRLIERDPQAARGEIAAVAQISRDALAQVRHAVTGIRAAGLVAELASARVLLDMDGIVLEDRLEPLPLPSGHETALALVLREAATNVQRHAQAKRVRVSLQAQGGQALLDITDDGRGGVIVPGNGLAGMRARLQAVGGALEVEALPRGMRLRASVPLPQPVPEPAQPPAPLPLAPQPR
ncbi:MULTISPECIES: sensor histidine kinase [Xanthomonas]|uniref:Sensor histidine kinase n=1 Tax=Xanthomonas cucurbitae TaxID=56453 RepID=A0A2S7DX40_9XANT|nr:sensor histidine kinase [Xanthomonas cucurbitae]PPU78393.1 two-component sensor histidine kinase [Xanthomonas cucurbitae]QHG88656.1 sensor histidine kinase [Xanthomonas cucurbitae]WDM67948.1 sensor histidine kinase [Xanthomonas cucurbitae]WDM71822.1 sensor histidine kinase [Xanthomonas cucurbitae]WDM75240.1 sensor histidine kinase [Xanthomonas cucurbitae]